MAWEGGGHVTFRWGKVTGGGLWVKSRTAATVFNLQTGAKKRERKKTPACWRSVSRSDCCRRSFIFVLAKKGAANAKEFTVG